jgi:hypothetical protein
MIFSGIFRSDERNPVPEDGLGRRGRRKEREKRTKENQMRHLVNKKERKFLRQKTLFWFYLNFLCRAMKLWIWF